MPKHYEFNKHSYYALIRASTQREAFGLYVEYVVGENVHEIMAEGEPDVISMMNAFNKVVTVTIRHNNLDFREAANQFHEKPEESRVLLIDGSLQ